MSTGDKAFLQKKIISADGPSAREVEHDVLLQSWCATCIEPEEESNRRRSVLERINSIVRNWIKTTMITEFRVPPETASQIEGRVFATGSYRYNVHTSGSDIDMVLIAPNRITREHFFNSLAQRFLAESWVSELNVVRDARVPIISMMCDGIDIDLSFGSIRQDKVPEVITDDLLQGLDEVSVASCNAVRVAHCVMDLVPNKGTFRQALRFVKAWGKARNIYSNTFGFPSGIGWAILVAFVCQCHPNQNAAGVVSRFFRIYTTWFKPNPHESGRENRAIYLTESGRVKTNLGRSWDPREYMSDALALFPVLTPALPYGNACYNVTLTNLRQLCDEFARGHEIISKYLPTMSSEEARHQLGPFGVWTKLLEPVEFFGVYKHYIHIQIGCTDPQLYNSYVPSVEAKIRRLWCGTEESRGRALDDYKQLRLHLCPKRFEDPEEVAARAAALRAAKSHAKNGASGDPTRVYTAHYFIGMSVEGQMKGEINLAVSIRAFHNVVRQLGQYRADVTILPRITVVGMSKIPKWVTGDLPKASTAGATSGASEVGSTNEISGPAAEAPAATPTPAPTSSVTATSMPSKRPRESDDATSGTSGTMCSSAATDRAHGDGEVEGNVPNGKGGATAANAVGQRTAPAPKPTAVEELECALGLDF